MKEKHVRRAMPDDALWIVDLSARVQAALTASGSLQQIGPLPLESVRVAINAGNAYIMEVAQRPVGSVLVDPLADDDPSVRKWKVQKFPGPFWYLHAFMLAPQEQGKRLGLDFLAGVRRLVTPTSGTIFLDCWAGNEKLRDFYQRAGFTFHDVFAEQDYKVAVFFASVEETLGDGSHS